jgi:adenylate cyclase
LSIGEKMPLEIERKFLVRDGWPRNTGGEPYRQGYLKQSGDPPTIRVRRAGGLAFLTIKSQPAGLVRDEYEYRIPADHAEEMLASLCHHPLIEKVRHKVPHAGVVWEIDEFQGVNAGLVMAEVELHDPDQPFEKPEWIGAEVTGDPRYSNSALSRHPYTTWVDAD